MEALRASWVGQAVFAAGRGRIDIVEGELPGVFVKGDYMLIDSASTVIADPDSKTFTDLVPHGDASAITRATNLGTTVKDVNVSVDSLGDGEAIDGRPTRRYRVKTTYAVVVDVSGVAGLSEIPPRRVDMTQTVDYWLVDVRDLPSIPSAFAGFP